MFIPRPSDCKKCQRCYRHRVEEIAAIAFIFGMIGCEVVLIVVNHAARIFGR